MVLERNHVLHGLAWWLWTLFALLGDVADGQNANKISQDLTSQQVLFYVQSYEPIKKMVHDNYSKGITSSLNGRSAQK